MKKRRSRGRASRERMRKWEKLQKEKILQKQAQRAGHVMQGYFMAAQAGYGFGWKLRSWVGLTKVRLPKRVVLPAGC